MTAVVDSFTAEDLERLPQDQCRYELILGELLAKPPLDAKTGQCAALLSLLIAKHVDNTQAGTSFMSGTRFQLRKNPETILLPDYAFIRSDRVPFEMPPRRYIPGVPDLVVDVLFPGQRASGFFVRIDEWLTFGSRLIWVVNAEKENVYVYAPGRQFKKCNTDQTLSGEDVLPGFELAIGAIFH